LPGLRIENSWATGVMWEEFHRFLHDKIVWMTPVPVVSEYFDDRDCRKVLLLGLDGGAGLRVRATDGAVTAVCSGDGDLRLFASPLGRP
jgi:hypothetical protein